MPITRSAKKALRQSVRRKVKNVEQRDAYKSAVKTYKKLVAAKMDLPAQAGEARAKLAAAYKALDKAAKTGAIKANKAARIKSRLAKALKK
ncbi:MAG: 30S ribosomal protein S20 [Candidatus Liptonbacteria bacterium]|nr:30S ribosomal protein S20 [Candidatus Liptonbacteria bacterium]